MSSYGQMFASQIASTVPAAVLMQDAATANGVGSSLDASGYATALLSITSSVSMSGGTTINFEASVDGSTWTPILGTKVGTTSSGSTTLEPGDWVFSIAGYKYVRARISDYSAGEITIQGFATVLTVAGISSGGGGSGGDTQMPETYTVSAAAASPVATIFEMSGSSSKIIRIHEIGIWFYNTIAGGSSWYRVELVRRSSACSGGTSTNLAPAKCDTNNAASTVATLKHYTVAPSLGTSVAILANCSLGTTPHGVAFKADSNTQPIVLRGTSEFVTLDLTSVLISGVPYCMPYVVFTEESS